MKLQRLKIQFDHISFPAYSQNFALCENTPGRKISICQK